MVAGRAFFVVFLRFYLLCGAAGVPGAACCVRPGCAVGGGPPASRPRREPFARVGCCLWRRWCSGRRMARPPARLGDLTSFGAAPRSPPVPSGPSGALHTGGAWSLMCGSARRLEARPGPAGLAAASNRSGCLCVARPRPAANSLISHAIPPRLFQILKLDRWNCNVFRLY